MRGSTESFDAGEAFDVEIIAVDAELRQLTDFNGSVGILTTDPNDPPPPLMNAVAGAATIPTIAVTAGTGFRISGVDLSGTGLASVQSSAYTVSAGAPATLAVILPGQTPTPSVSGPEGGGTADEQEAGTPFEVTVIVTDAWGNTVSGASGEVSLVTSDLRDTNPSPELLSGGQATFTVSPVIATSAARVTASHGTLGNSSSDFYVVRGAPAAEIVVLLPTQGLQVTTGGPVLVGFPPDQTVGRTFLSRIQAVDQFGNIDAGSTGEVSVTTTDPLDADPITGTLTAGEATIEITPVQPGSDREITASATGFAPATSSAFDVLSRPADRLIALLPGQSLQADPDGPIVSGAAPQQVAGQGFQMTIRATDQFGNVDTTFNESVDVTTPDDPIDTDPGSVLLSNGEAQTSVMNLFATIGQQVSAEHTSLTTGLSSEYDVVAGPASSMVVLLPGETLDPGATGGTVSGTPAQGTPGVSQSVQVILVDNWGNQATGPNRRVNLTTPLDGADTHGSLITSLGEATFSHRPITANDSYTYVATDDTAEFSAAISSPQEVAAVANRLAVLLSGQSIAIQDDFDGFAIAGTTSTKETGQSFDASVFAVDFFGNVDDTANETIVLTSSDTLDTEPGPQALVSGMTIFTLFPASQGTGFTLTADDGMGGLSAGTSRPYDVVAGAGRLVVLMPGQTLSASSGGPVISGMTNDQIAGQSFTARVRATDAFGNIDTSATNGVTLESPVDAEAGSLTANLLSGAYDFSFTAVTAQSNYFVRASASGLTDGDSSEFGTVAAGADRLVVTLSGQSIDVTAAGPAVSGAPPILTAGIAANVRVSATDPFGNVDETSTTEVTLSSNDPGASESVANLVAGTRLLPFTAFVGTSGGLDLTATDTGGGGLLTGNQSGLSVDADAVAALFPVAPGQQWRAGPSGPVYTEGLGVPQEIGVAFDVTVYATDAWGNVTPGTAEVELTTGDSLDTEPAPALLGGTSVALAVTPASDGTSVMEASDIDGDPLMSRFGAYRVYPFFLGQTDGTTNGSGTSAGTLSAPRDAALFIEELGTGPIYVADTGNNRVLGWSQAAQLASAMPAELVLGQVDFTSGSCNQGNPGPDDQTLCAPTGVAVDSSGNLWVADSGNNRALRFDDPFGTGDATADRVLGQAGFLSADCNGPTATVGASVLCGPEGVALGPNGEVYVADTGNSRVLGYGVAPASGAAATLVLGQADKMTAGCNTGGISASTLCLPATLATISSGLLFVADTENSRVLRFDPADGDGAAATRVFGQGTFGTSDCNGSMGAVAAETLCRPVGVSIDESGNLWVSDTGDGTTSNSRIVGYPAPFGADGPLATAVFGKQDLMSGGCNTTPSFGADSLCRPAGVLWWADVLIVADSGNNRVPFVIAPAP